MSTDYVAVYILAGVVSALGSVLLGLALRELVACLKLRGASPLIVDAIDAEIAVLDGNLTYHQSGMPPASLVISPTSLTIKPPAVVP